MDLESRYVTFDVEAHEKGRFRLDVFCLEGERGSAHQARGDFRNADDLLRAIGVPTVLPQSDAALRIRGVLCAVPSTPKHTGELKYMPPEAYVSARVIAEHLDIQIRQVLAMTRAGKLPAHPVDPTAVRKQWRYKVSEVDAAIGW
jgi:hypothetical protein